MNLAQSLLTALRDHGAGQVFGIPGDFVLAFFKVVEESAILPLYTLSHERSVGFAADAAARFAGAPGVAAVTYGAGALNMVNPVAAAYAEKSPLVVVSGAPGQREGRGGLVEALGLNLPESDGLSSNIGKPASRPQRYIIGFVGELREKKGLKTLLSAYAQVNKRQPVILLIVGEIRQGEDKLIFDEFRISNPDSQIFVTGYISPTDLPAYYSLLDVFVHPSLRDGMPNALLEAMASGKAVIATPVGGIPDLIKDGENAWLVPVENPDALATAIQSLLHDPELRARLGRPGRDTVVAQCSLQKELEGNLDVYRRFGLNPYSNSGGL